MPPAARITDRVAHPLPGMLMPGPGSLNVLIGYLPAWRAVPSGAGSGLEAAKQASEIRIQVAESATKAASGTPGYPAAKAAEEALKVAEAAAMAATITSMAGGADIHACMTPLPVPPHGPGVVTSASKTVVINNLPACRVGDKVMEAIGPPDNIVMGENTVLIG